MFSRPVRHVAATSIFAALLPEGRQSLIYAMDFEAVEELAMVLPLPVAEGAGEDAVEFVDLSGYDTFFDDLAAAFPPVMLQAKSRGAFGGAPPPRTLRVHEVGSFEASFVPNRADFARLDPRFRLPDAVWKLLGRYEGWGFAVIRLKPRSRLFGLHTEVQRIHPMALSFPSRDPRSLFFPTVHVHDATLPPTAAFDHSLYAQPDPIVSATIGWQRPSMPISAAVDPVRAHGLIGSGDGFRAVLLGELPNDDVWLRPLCGVSLDALTGRGDSWRYSVRARWAYETPPNDARFARWRQTSLTRLDRLVAALPEALRHLEHTRRAQWRLAPYDESLPAHFINGRELWSGTNWLDGRREAGSGPGRVEFAPFGENVEQQAISLAFKCLPDPATTGEIIDTLAALLDRAVA